LTTKELETLFGQKITTKHEFILIGAPEDPGSRLFNRIGKDDWHEYARGADHRAPAATDAGDGGR
jgi:hypothetical protein